MRGLYCLLFSCILPLTPANIIHATNQDRIANKMPALTENVELDKAALLHGDDMAGNGYFAHVSPAGITPWQWIGMTDYYYWRAGENLGIFYDDTNKLEMAFMASPGHRANILNPKFKNIGIAVVDGTYAGHNTEFVVVMFGEPYKNEKIKY